MEKKDAHLVLISAGEFIELVGHKVRIDHCLQDPSHKDLVYIGDNSYIRVSCQEVKIITNLSSIILTMEEWVGLMKKAKWIMQSLTVDREDESE